MGTKVVPVQLSIPDRQTSDQKRPTAVCVELAARYDELHQKARTVE